MTTLDETVAALARRVAELERDNARLQAQVLQRSEVPALAGEPSRRGLLVGGAGLVGMLAGGALSRPGLAAAAADSPQSLAHVVQAGQLIQPRLLGVRVTVPSQRGGGNHWATYAWDLGAHFTGSEAPVVVAAVHDNYHFANSAAEPTCAVEVRREAGAWRATILVNNVAHLASEVTISAIALGA